MGYTTNACAIWYLTSLKFVGPVLYIHSHNNPSKVGKDMVESVWVKWRETHCLHTALLSFYMIGSEFVLTVILLVFLSTRGVEQCSLFTRPPRLAKDIF